MYENTTVGVVVPAHNEAAHIGEVIGSISSFVDRCYVVDDCSNDGTWAEIMAQVEPNAPRPVITADGGVDRDLPDGPVSEGATPAADAGEVGIARSSTGDGVGLSASPGPDGEYEDTVVPVRHRVNRGRGGAVKTGYQLAMVEGMDVVAVIDGDGQMDPDILDRIIDPVVAGDADYAKGNRLVDPDHWAAMSRWRLFGNAVLSLLTKVASGYWRMRDPQNGYTAVSAETLADVGVDHLYEDYGFLNDVLVRMGAHGKRVVDVPMTAVYEDEESGIQYRSFVPKLSWLLLCLFMWRLWTTYGLGDARSASVKTAD
jgi:glycosyltransferase involved in cell wall biosynthesis